MQTQNSGGSVSARVRDGDDSTTRSSDQSDDRRRQAVTFSPQHFPTLAGAQAWTGRTASMSTKVSPRRNYYESLQVHEPHPQPRSRHRTTGFSLATPTSQTRPRKIQLGRIPTTVRSRRHLPPSSPQNRGSDMTPNLLVLIPHLGVDQLILSHLRISKISVKPGHTMADAAESIPLRMRV